MTLPSIFGLRALVIAAAIAFVAGTGAGWKLREMRQAQVELKAEQVAQATAQVETTRQHAVATTHAKAAQQITQRYQESDHVLSQFIAAQPAAALDCDVGADGLRLINEWRQGRDLSDAGGEPAGAAAEGPAGAGQRPAAGPAPDAAPVGGAVPAVPDSPRRPR